MAAFLAAVGEAGVAAVGRVGIAWLRWVICGILKELWPHYIHTKAVIFAKRGS